MESIDVLPDYTLNAFAYNTNMWSPQILEMDQTLFYAAVLGVAFAAVAVAVLVVARKRKK